MRAPRRSKARAPPPRRAGRRGRARKRADAAPGSVDLDVLEAGGAVELALVARLDAGLADEVGTAVVRVDPLLLEALLVGLVDAAHVAHHVRGDVVVRVLAEEARLDRSEEHTSELQSRGD